MADFDTLMQQHEMGIAYKQITDQMGPSPQLTAFVNYGKIDFDNAGLESLDIDVDHQMTLNEIDGNQAYEMACESLATRLDTFGKLGVAGSIAANIIAEFVPMGSTTQITTSILAAVLGGLGGGAMVLGYKNNIWKKDTHDLVEKVFDKQLHSLQEMISKIPKGFNESDWKSFVDYAVKEQNKNKVNPNSSVLHWFADSKLVERNKVLFEKSGWSPESLKVAAQWLKDAATKMHNSEKKITAETHRLKSFVEKADHETAVTTKYIAQSVSVLEDLTKRVNECLRASHRVITDAGRHFKVE